MNLPTTFDPIAYTREVENAAYAAGWTVRHLWPMEIGPRPWFQRVAPGGDRASPKLYLSAGIHGDEISGPLALLEMIRQPGFFAGFDVTMFPILNPNGLALGVRTNRDEIDLHRDYRNSRSLEIKGHIESLLTLGRFDASMLLHEDYEGIRALGQRLLRRWDSMCRLTCGPKSRRRPRTAVSSRGAISSPN